MDVRCERCRANYVFDDDKVTEAGLTIQCSKCGHLFRVKRKALVVTVPVRPEEMAHVVPVSPEEAARAPSSPAVEKAREWRIRQPSGNVFTFKELTTLQKWIVERKVSRDDEISLSGDQWKRLGNIAELSAFFQVVDEAGRSKAPPPTAPIAFPAAGFTPPSAHSAPPFVPPTPLPAPPPPAALPFAPRAAPAPTADPSPLGNSGETGPESGPAAGATPALDGDPAWTEQPSTESQAELETEIDTADLEGGGTGEHRAMSRRAPKLGLLVGIALLVAGGAALLLLGVGGTPRVKPDAPAKVAPANTPPAAPSSAAPSAGPAPGASPATARPAPSAAPAGAAGPSAPPGAGPKETPPPAAAKGPRALLAQARKLREQEQCDRALLIYERILADDPKNSEALSGKGWCHLDLAQYGPSKASFEQALEHNPRYSEALLGLAETYRFEGRKAEAVKFYEEYLATDPDPDGEDAVAARNALNQLKE